MTRDLTDAARQTAEATRSFAGDAMGRLKELIAGGGEVDRAQLVEQQYAAHGCAWIAAYGRAIDVAVARLDRETGELAARVLALGIAEYAAQMAHGIAMSQGELVRPADMGLEDAARRLAEDDAVVLLRELTGTPAFIAELVGNLAVRGPDAGFGDDDEESHRLMREQCRRFVDRSITHQTKAWH